MEWVYVRRGNRHNTYNRIPVTDRWGILGSGVPLGGWDGGSGVVFGEGDEVGGAEDGDGDGLWDEEGGGNG